MVITKEIKEKIETDEYIKIEESRLGVSTYRTIDNLNELQPFYSKLHLIHKKHKAILDAYLLDNSVKIEQCSNGDWYEININPYYDAFIRFYNENNQYRLKQKKEFNFIEHNMPETIQAQNSDKKFLKPEFECELWHRDRTYILGKVRLPYDIKLCRWDMDTGICREDEKYNLTPYQEKKEWYRDESNFPCVIVDKMNHNDIRIVKENMGINWEVYRPATNEEIDSLKIKDANF